MKKKYFTIFFLFIFLTEFVYPQKNRKVVFVIADGISYDHIIKQKMPNLEKLTKNGGLVQAYVGGEIKGYSETPTISAPGYNNLLTGTWGGSKHNVLDNEILHANYNYWNVFRFFKTAYPNKKTAIFSTWEDNRTKLIGSNAAAAGNIQPDYIFDGYEKDTVKFPHDDLGEFYNKIDSYVIDKASESIKKNAPYLSWIYLEYTDEMGHRYGDGEKVNKALAALDIKIGKLWDAVQYREKKFNEEWMVIITTDHGRDIDGFHHGNQSNRERNTWIACNYGKLNKYFFTEQPGIVDIAPTILKFLNVVPQKERMFELDGVPFIGKISGIYPNAILKENKLTVSWIPTDTLGNTKIWIATTNNFKTGSLDKYTLVKELPLRDWQTVIDVSAMPSKFYKVVIEMPHNTLNRWVINDK